MADPDIHALNLSVLNVLHDNARTDIPLACYRFGVTRDFAQRIAEMSSDDIKRLAVSDNLLFSLRTTPTIGASA